MTMTIILTILVIADTILTWKVWSDYLRYKRTLETIAYGNVSYPKMVGAAIKALKNYKGD